VDYIKLANQYSSSDKEVSKERESTDKNANGNSTRKERKNGRAIPKKGQKEKRASEKSKPNGKSGETAKGKRKVAKRKKKKANRKVRAEAESTDDSDENSNYITSSNGQKQYRTGLLREPTDAVSNIVNVSKSKKRVSQADLMLIENATLTDSSLEPVGQSKKFKYSLRSRSDILKVGR
jgi:hypothetical protein